MAASGSGRLTTTFKRGPGYGWGPLLWRDYLKLIITGSRNWEDFDHFSESLEVFTYYKRPEKVTLVHGGARGADSMCDQWAERWNYWYPGWVDVKIYPAEWGKHGKAAGIFRNMQMVEDNLDADYVLAFPLGESRGTRHCMDHAKRFGLTVVNLGEK